MPAPTPHTYPFALRRHYRYDAKRAVSWSGATPRQLRYWDETDLVRPTYQRPNGHPGIPRLYSAWDLVRLRIVVELKARGWSVQQVRDYLGTGLTLEELVASMPFVLTIPGPAPAPSGRCG